MRQITATLDESASMNRFTAPATPNPNLVVETNVLEVVALAVAVDASVDFVERNEIAHCISANDAHTPGRRPKNAEAAQTFDIVDANTNTY